MSDIANSVPVDPKGNPFNRAMSTPICSDTIVLGSTQYVDIFDLEDYGDRAFIGMAVYNPSSNRTIRIAIGENFSQDKCLAIQPQGFLALDLQLFGYGMANSFGNMIRKFRASLSAAEGTAASGTITYSGTNVTNGMCVTLNGITYEFSSDQSAAPGRVKVDIGANADASWTNLRNAINANDQALLATIDTGTNVLTLTSNYGGAYGNSTPIADGDEGGNNDTGATFSGATLASGTGGVTPIIQIW